MSERSKQSKKPAPWFRVFSAETITRTLGLNAAEFAVYFRLLLAMNEADEPVGGRALEMLPGLLGIRKKTFSDAVETLIERNLIERLADGLWSAKMDDERAFRDRNSDKARTNSVKRWRKTQQNQSGSDASHSHTHREPPQGGSQYADRRDDLDIDGSASAYAGRPDIGGEREDTFTAGDPSFDGREDFFAGDLGEQPAWLAEIPPPTSLDDYGEYDAADHPIAAGQSGAADEKIAAKSGDLQLLERCERQAKRLGDFYSQLVADMRAGLQSGRDLTNGERTMLRDEILPAVRGFERQPGPSEIEWEKSNGGQHAVNGETNAPAR